MLLPKRKARNPARRIEASRASKKPPVRFDVPTPAARLDIEDSEAEQVQGKVIPMNREKKVESQVKKELEEQIENPIEESEEEKPEKLKLRFDFQSSLKTTAEKQAEREKSNGEINSQFTSDFKVDKPGFADVGTPELLSEKLGKVGYQCLPFIATQIALLLNTPSAKTKALLLEGPSGCGKSFMAKSLAKITGAELMCLSCYNGMPTQNLIESPSTLAMVNQMAGKGDKETKAEDLMNLGILSKAFLKSQEKPVILLIDELDKPDGAIDTFFLGPIQDARIWLESRPPIDANPENLLLIFTKNWNRVLDEALLRRLHPVKMTYLDSTLERKILSPHCHPQLVSNLVMIADRMRNSNGAYEFERPPAPEELLTAGLYITQLLEWDNIDFKFIGKSIWSIISKSEHDRAVLDHMLRFHPDFIDPLFPDARNAPLDEIHARLGRVVLDKIVDDPDRARREEAWKNEFEY